jgi:hypothetical protein
MAESTPTIRKIGAYIPINHELLLDSGRHTCDDACPAPQSPPPVPLARRLQSKARSLWWQMKRLPGYRLAHKDDIGGGWDE